MHKLSHPSKVLKEFAIKMYKRGGLGLTGYIIVHHLEGEVREDLYHHRRGAA